METATETKNPSELPAWFKELPAGKKFLEDHQRELNKQRRAKIEELQAARQELTGKMLPAIDAEITETEGEVERAKAALTEAVQRHGIVTRRRLDATSAFSRLQERAQQILRMTAPACIGEWARELQKEIEVMMAGNPVSHEDFGGLLRKKRFFSDYESRQRRMRAVRDLLFNIDKVRFECIDEAEALKRIAELRASIPEIKLEEVKS